MLHFYTPQVTGGERAVMQISSKQIITAGIGFVLAMGLLYAGQQIYNRTVVQQPLTAAVRKIHGVRHAALAGAGSATILQVSLDSGANLALVYHNTEHVVNAVVGHSMPIRLLDNRTPAESALYGQLRFVIAQGQATGHLVAMDTTVLADARAAGDRAALVLGNQHLYLTLTDRQHHRLLAVLPIGGGGTHV